MASRVQSFSRSPCLLSRAGPPEQGPCPSGPSPKGVLPDVALPLLPQSLLGPTRRTCTSGGEGMAAHFSDCLILLRMLQHVTLPPHGHPGSLALESHLELGAHPCLTDYSQVAW